MSNEIDTRIRELILECSYPQDLTAVTDKQTFRELGIDEFNFFEILATIEEEFGRVAEDGTSEVFDNNLDWTVGYFIEFACYSPLKILDFSAKELVNYLFSLNSTFVKTGFYEEPVCVLKGFPRKLERLQDILGDYTELIAEIVAIKTYGQDPESKAWKYPLDSNAEALLVLCNIKSPTATNILHEVLNRPMVEVPISLEGYYGVLGQENYNWKHLTLEPLKVSAKEELLNRGNPPYNPGIYADKSVWKF